MILIASEMKTIFLIICLSITVTSIANSQIIKIDSSYAHAHYQQRLEFFEKMPNQKNEIVFLGNSIIEHGEWQELLAGVKAKVINGGIGGDNTFGVLARLDEVLVSKPQKILLLIGINDLFRNLPCDVIIHNYKRILDRVKWESLGTKIYIHSILPINEEMTNQPYTVGRNTMVPLLNKLIRKLGGGEKITYIDLHPLFIDEKGMLKKEISIHRVHLKASAYIDWVAYLKKMKYM